MVAYPFQKLQDWVTQQWVIFWGQRIDRNKFPWLMGPFGKLGSISDHFVNQLAEEEDLLIERNSLSHGLLPSIQELKLSHDEYDRLSPEIVHFYENTTLYKLNFSVQWNPLFRIFGALTMNLFSSRIKQLNIPTTNLDSINQINSEIITLKEPGSGEVKYTIWYRTFIPTGQVLYSGVYTTCMLPSGKICMKAIFPLPNGNATVIMLPTVGPRGELRLNSSGKKFGDPGFYFLLKDANGGSWSQYIGSFRDHLNVFCVDGNLFAEQTLTLWHQQVVRFNYEIHRKQ